MPQMCGRHLWMAHPYPELNSPEQQRDCDEGGRVPHAGRQAAELVHREGHGLEGHVEHEHHRVLRATLKL